MKGVFAGVFKVNYYRLEAGSLKPRLEVA